MVAKDWLDSTFVEDRKYGHFGQSCSRHFLSLIQFSNLAITELTTSYKQSGSEIQHAQCTVYRVVVEFNSSSNKQSKAICLIMLQNSCSLNYAQFMPSSCSDWSTKLFMLIMLDSAASIKPLCLGTTLSQEFSGRLHKF